MKSWLAINSDKRSTSSSRNGRRVKRDVSRTAIAPNKDELHATCDLFKERCHRKPKNTRDRPRHRTRRVGRPCARRPKIARRVIYIRKRRRLFSARARRKRRSCSLANSPAIMRTSPENLSSARLEKLWIAHWKKRELTARKFMSTTR